MKQCKKCNQEKSYNEFYKQSISKDGYHSYCKECAGKSSYDYLKINSEIVGKGVYGLWNKIEHCWDYIGEGKLYDRFKIHKYALSKGTPPEIRLNIWFDGFENVYDFKTLIKCKDKQQCKIEETHYINQLKPRYNRHKFK